MRNRLSRTKKVVVGTSVALGSLGLGGVGFALANGGGAGAASSTPSSTGTNPNLTKGQKLHRFLRRHTVDGTITVKTKNGYETLNFARGTITSVSPSSITIASPDSTSLTASITSETKYRNTTQQQLADGDKVGVIAANGVARLILAPKAAAPTS